MKFGEFFKMLRCTHHDYISIREFCLKYGYDSGNISKLERGLLPPPRSERKLKRYLRALKVKPGSREWFEFLELANEGICTECNGTGRTEA